MSPEKQSTRIYRYPTYASFPWKRESMNLGAYANQ